MADEIDLNVELEKLQGVLSSARRFLPVHVRDQLEMLQRVLKRGTDKLHARLEADQDGSLNIFADDPKAAAEELAEWARGEDPAKVGRVLEAIRGGHVSDLPLMF